MKKSQYKSYTIINTQSPINQLLKYLIFNKKHEKYTHIYIGYYSKYFLKNQSDHSQLPCFLWFCLAMQVHPHNSRAHMPALISKICNASIELQKRFKNQKIFWTRCLVRNMRKHFLSITIFRQKMQRKWYCVFSTKLSQTHDSLQHYFGTNNVITNPTYQDITLIYLYQHYLVILLQILVIC
eukprot:TRINITY_DN10583_c0_g1_i1.p1 TRINITY_DN10583_c0_g1~~TRINITY_DN10583_c0_g1_i1.p1  ORF type:complete len:195 (-),score=-16.34 TRINITY_DN10583_c0_g1_i1:16-561(-)